MPASPEAKKAVRQRLLYAEQMNGELEDALNDATGGFYSMYEQKQFSAETKAGLDYVDWRVPRLALCKDPYYNLPMPADPRIAKEIADIRVADGDKLEKELALEAWEKWGGILAPAGRIPPPVEVVTRPGAKFVEANPMYRRESDIWERRLELRSLDEAMTGDVTTPMPRPVLFAEDYQNFKEGRYLKDDCPIA